MVVKIQVLETTDSISQVDSYWYRYLSLAAILVIIPMFPPLSREGPILSGPKSVFD